jgi:hypothetical protein
MKPTGRRGFALVYLRVAFLLMASIGFSFADEFSFCSVGKGIYYDQTGGGNPVLKMPRTYWFRAELRPEGYFQWAQLKPPVGSSIPLFRATPVTPFMAWRGFTNETSLNAAFSEGDYVFVSGNFPPTQQPLMTNSLVSGAFPSTPTIANLSEAQSVDASADFTLVWEPFAGGVSGDFISVEIQNSTGRKFLTPEFGTGGALNGTATSVIIPANTLSPGHAYLGRLVFEKTVGLSTNAQFGATGAVFLFSQTDFWIKTQGPGDTTPPEILSTMPVSGSTNVPVNLPIGIYFSERMKPSFSIAVEGSGGGSSGGFFQGFSPDAKAFVLTLVPPYSSGDAKTVILNPLEDGLAFGDENGNPLPPDTAALSLVRGASQITPMSGLLAKPEKQFDSTFSVTLSGETNFAYSLEYSTNLIQWIPLKTNVAFYGTAHFVDSNSISEPMRFYRAVPR